MTKTEFLEKLKQGLEAVPADERVAAMQYYTEYLDDAGLDREQEVLEELGSPEEVAALIRAESEADGWVPPEKNEQEQKDDAGINLTLNPDEVVPPVQETPPPLGQQDAFGMGEQPKGPQPPPYGQAQGTPPPYGYGANGGSTPPPWQGAQGAGTAPKKEKDKGLMIALGILAVIFLSPVIGGLLSAAVGVLAAALVVLLVPLIVGVSLIAAGIVAIVAGAFGFAISVPTGLLNVGLGVIVLGLGLLCTFGGVVLLVKVIPAIFRGIAALFRKIFKRNKNVAGPNTAT